MFDILKMCLWYFALNLLVCNFVDSSLRMVKNASIVHFGNQTGVSDSPLTTDQSDNVFPYIAAIMEKSRYLCAGALIDDLWVLTAARSVYLYKGSLRFIRIRLGSNNNKDGGELHPIKLIEFHPDFEERKPQFDLALIQLPWKVMTTPNFHPIRLQMRSKKITTTHFVVTSWPIQSATSENNTVLSQDAVLKRRMLRVEHLHPLDHDHCMGEMEEVDIPETDMMCLDRGEELDPCSADIGAPVVLNNILWGVVSSWVPEDCDLDPGPMVVNLVASRNISTWIEKTIKKQELKVFNKYDYEDSDSGDDDDGNDK